MRARDRLRAAVAGCPAGSVLGLWAVLHLPFAGTRNLYYEEGRYALAALDAFANGHFVRPEVLGQAFVMKPPLLFWLIGLSTRLGGVSEWAIRAPALLASLLGGLLVERAARRLAGPAAGLLAAVAFLLSPHLFVAGARAEPDLFVTVASFAAFTVWLESRQGDSRTAALGWAAATGLLAATAFLKGPLPLGTFVIGSGLVAVSERRWRELPGLALMDAIALSSVLAWGIAVYRPGDEAAFRDMVRTGGWTAPGRYLAGVVRFAAEAGAHFLPWVVLAVVPLSAPWRRREGLDARTVLPFAFYALGGTVPLALWPHALARYAMPAVPAITVLAGLGGAALLRAGPRGTRAAVRGLLVAAVAVRLAWLAAIPFDSARNEAARRLAASLSAPLGGSTDPLLVLGPAVDYNAAFYLQRAGLSPRAIRSAAEIVPPAWLITAAAPPPGAREAARAATRRGVVYRTYRVEAPP